MHQAFLDEYAPYSRIMRRTETENGVEVAGLVLLNPEAREQYSGTCVAKSKN